MFTRVTRWRQPQTQIPHTCPHARKHDNHSSRTQHQKPVFIDVWCTHERFSAVALMAICSFFSTILLCWGELLDKSELHFEHVCQTKYACKQHVSIRRYAEIFTFINTEISWDETADSEPATRQLSLDLKKKTVLPLFSTFMGVELIYTDVGDYSLFLWALLALIPIWPHTAHLQPFRQFALEPEYCLHVLHEVSVHWSSTIWKRSRHEEVSVSIESSLSLTGSSAAAAASFFGWKGRGFKLQICVFTGSSFNLNPFFFFLCSTFGPAAPCRAWTRNLHRSNTKRNGLPVFVLYASRKLNVIPNSAFLEPHHSVAFMRDPSVEPFTTHVCRLFHLSVDTSGSNAV